MVVETITRHLRSVRLWIYLHVKVVCMRVY